MAGSYIRTPEHKKMMSENSKGRINYWQKGKKRSPRLKEWCDKLSLAKKNNKECVKNLGIWCTKDKPYFPVDIKGEKNPNWKGGLSKSRSTIYDSLGYREWRNSVFQRDYYTCQRCGDDKGHNLVAHHIIPFSFCIKENKELLYIIKNGITLCDSCHKLLHKNKEIPQKWWVDSIIMNCRSEGIPVFVKNSLIDLWGEKYRIQQFPEV